MENGLDQLKGAFVASLKRNNKQIRQDRALAIAEDAELIYKREIEDLQKEIKTVRREQESMLDLSPTDAKSLTLASDFNAKNWVSKHLELGIKLRNLEIKIEVAQKQYAYLFEGDNTNVAEVEADVNLN